LVEQLTSETLETLKEDFTNTPIMALMAKISEDEQDVPCAEHYHGLVLVKSTVVKKNITVNIESIAPI